MARRRPTPASRLAALATGVLALLLGGATVSAETTAAVLLDSAVFVAALAGGAKMWFHNCFESRLVVLMAVAATVAGTTLALTVGTPGRSPVEPSGSHVLLLTLSTSIALLLAADSRIRRARRSPVVPPYAL